MAQQLPLGHGLHIIEDSRLQTHHKTMSPVGFEPTIPVGEWPQTHALDRAATGFDIRNHCFCVIPYRVAQHDTNNTVLVY